MNKDKLLKPFQDLKAEIEKLKNKHLVQGLVDKFHTEKKSLEKKIEKVVVDEVRKAKQFMNEQKKELNRIQKKVETAISKKKKVTTKKKPAKKVKKATKKAASKKI